MNDVVPFSEHITQAEADELDRLLTAISDEASGFEALGRSLGAAAAGEDAEERGRSAFRRRIGEIRAALCANAAIKGYCSNPTVSDSTSIAVAIAGGLTAAHFSGLNVFLVAALVTRIGLREVCRTAA